MIKKIIIPFFKGVFDATPLSSIVNAFKKFKDSEKPNSNIMYLGTFILTLVSIVLFVLKHIDYDQLEDLIKLFIKLFS